MESENNSILRRYSSAEKEIKTFYVLFFIALASAFAFIEYMIPKPLPMLRIGLANVVVILFIVRKYYRTSLIIAFIRPIIVSFIVGNIFSPPFWLALGGSFISAVMMIIVHRLLKNWISVISLSLIGAYTHVTVQLILVYLFGILLSLDAVISIGSIMSVMALIGGVLTGAIAIYLDKRL